jgi:hypothetical protein
MPDGAVEPWRVQALAYLAKVREATANEWKADRSGAASKNLNLFDVQSHYNEHVAIRWAFELGGWRFDKETGLLSNHRGYVRFVGTYAAETQALDLMKSELAKCRRRTLTYEPFSRTDPLND